MINRCAMSQHTAGADVRRSVPQFKYNELSPGLGNCAINQNSRASTTILRPHELAHYQIPNPFRRCFVHMHMHNPILSPCAPQMHLTQAFVAGSADVPRTAPLSGANILHKHSINSLLEQQKLIDQSAAQNQKLLNANAMDSKYIIPYIHAALFLFNHKCPMYCNSSKRYLLLIYGIVE